MQQNIAHIALLVSDYDQAIAYYTQVLGFVLVKDETLSPTKRWVLVGPQGHGNFNLLLAKASNEEQLSHVGNQAAGRVFLFMYTSNIDAYYQKLQAHNVKIVRPLVHEAWGKVLVFADLYGNLWDLIEPVNNG